MKVLDKYDLQRKSYLMYMSFKKKKIHVVPF